MSQRYATIARDVIAADEVIAIWAEGGILDRDPRRSGSSATGAVFDTDGDGDILPTIAATPGNAVRSLGGPDTGYEGTVVIRLFTPDYPTYSAQIDTMVERITALLHGYRHSNDAPALFRWNSRLGLQAGGAFEDVMYDEVRFRVIGMHRMEVA